MGRRHCLLALLLVAHTAGAAVLQKPVRQPVQVVPLQEDADRCADDTALQPLLLDTIVNTTASGREIVYLQRPCGAVMARVEDLDALRIITTNQPWVKVNGERYVLLNAFPGLQHQVDEEGARMVMEGEPWVFRPTVIDLDAPTPPAALPAATGALFNYGLFAFGTFDAPQQRQTLQNYQFTLFGKPGVIDSQALLLGGNGRLEPFRVFTTATRDVEDGLYSLRAGDVFSRGGAWGVVRPLGGVQLARNFGLRPSLITTPVTAMDLALRRRAALALNGSSLFADPAELSSLYFGNLGAVPHGPVQVINIPAGFANRRLRLRAQQAGAAPAAVVQQDFFGLGLLRGGLRDYSYELGFNRRNFLGDDYQNPVGSFTERWGLTQWLTVEGHAEASDRRAVAGVSLSVAVPYAGVLDFSRAGTAQSPSSTPGESGSLVGLGLSNVYERFGYRFSYRHTTRGFVLPTFEDGARTRDQLSASVSAVAPGGSAFVGYARNRTYAGADPALNPAVELLFAGYAAQLPRGISVSVFLAESLRAPRDRNLSAALAVPFTVFDSLSDGRYATQAQLSVQQDDARRTRADVQMSRNFEQGESLYTAEVAQSVLGSDFSSLFGRWLHPRFLASAQLSRGAGGEAYGAGVAGSLALLGGRVMAAPPIANSFALVRLGEDYAGVRVNGRATDARGDALIPDLPPYVEAPIALDPSTLPLSFQPETLQLTARAPLRSGVILSPKLGLRRDALVRMLVREGGALRPAPIGSYATIDGRDEEFPAGDDGLLYFYGIGEVTTFRFYTRNGGCLVKLVLPPPPRPGVEALAIIPELGPFTCEATAP